MKYLTTLLLATLATSLTAAPPEGAKGKKPGGERRGPPASIIKKFDADGDGKLNEAEHAKAREEMEKLRGERLKEFDKDGDGKLTGDEQVAALKGMLAKSEGLKKKLTARFDADKSGDLSDAELAEAAKGFFRGGPGPKGKKPDARRGEGKKPGAKKGEGKKKKAE